MTTVISKEGKKLGKIELPEQFKEKYRPGLVKRAVLAQQSKKKTPYGAKRGAGMRHSTRWRKMRQTKYRTTYGYGISRTPKKIMARIGGGFANVMRFRAFRGAKAPNTTGGRRAFPPQTEKVIEKKINKKEKKKAIRCAISATMIKEIVSKRGHKHGKLELPIIISDIENIRKTKEVIESMEKIGLKEELKKAEKKKIRLGKGKRRGRRYKKSIGPLFVAAKNCGLIKAAKNIPGVDATTVEKLNAELLAPGTHPGRLVIWSKQSIERMGKEKLFM